ncbi:hypothetical protein ACFSO7_02815 [Bacillus sp. CGMCC 1.16607]|uniref:hypothetical protein n=1 Tax=Bacillus sp. CGMCC 1.16607 TaxID=3351842 RepID=UPI00364402C3
MAAILQYLNQEGKKKQVVFNKYQNKIFTALIKYYIQLPGVKRLQVMEKTSTRPATFYECCRYVEKLKVEHGNNLKQLIIWDVDQLKTYSEWW